MGVYDRTRYARVSHRRIIKVRRPITTTMVLGYERLRHAITEESTLQPPMVASAPLAETALPDDFSAYSTAA